PGHQGQAETEDRHRGRRPDQIDATEPQPAETTARRRPHQHAGHCRRHHRGELTWTNSPSSKTSSATTTSPPTARRSTSRPKLSNCAKNGNKRPPAPRRKAAP